jgi:hypothetical protein
MFIALAESTLSFESSASSMGREAEDDEFTGNGT